MSLRCTLILSFPISTTQVNGRNHGIDLDTQVLRHPCCDICNILASTQAALAQSLAHDYPNRDIHFICAFPAGSGADVLVRHFAEKLRPIINRAVIV